jgi:hypothetical protein
LLYIELWKLASGYVPGGGDKPFANDNAPPNGITMTVAFHRKPVRQALPNHFIRHIPKRRLAFDDKRNVPIVNCSIAVKERPELWSE